jgi:hypothetical protein
VQKPSRRLEFVKGSSGGLGPLNHSKERQEAPVVVQRLNPREGLQV